MSKRPRGSHSPAFQAKVALASVRFEETLAELAQQYDVQPNLINQWRARLLEDEPDVFGAEPAPPGTGGQRHGAARQNRRVNAGR